MKTLVALLLACAWLGSGTAVAQSGKVELLWLGQSALPVATPVKVIALKPGEKAGF